MQIENRLVVGAQLKKKSFDICFFFLGGKDAEMVEIQKILENYNLCFSNKYLKWGAKASDYSEQLRTIGTKIPVLIELEIDIDLPENSIIIDHHGSKAGRNQPTSIEQVAELLGISLNRWQQLISANDRGWIPGLKEAGAVKEEIEKIRRFDRSCQGVTDEMEREAERICSGIKRTHRPVIIRYSFDLASPITDRLYEIAENIVILGPNSTTFSGDGRIVRKMAEDYPQSFYGGELPERGFWGLTCQENLAATTIINYWEELHDKEGRSEV